MSITSVQFENRMITRYPAKSAFDYIGERADFNRLSIDNNDDNATVDPAPINGTPIEMSHTGIN